MQKPVAEVFPSEGNSLNWGKEKKQTKENPHYQHLHRHTWTRSDQSGFSPWNLHPTPNQKPFLDFLVHSEPPSSWIHRWGPPATLSVDATCGYFSQTSRNARKKVGKPQREEETHRGVHVSWRVAVGVCQHGDNANHDCLYRVDGKPTLLWLFITKLVFSGLVQNWDANVPVLCNCGEQEAKLYLKCTRVQCF